MDRKVSDFKDFVLLTQTSTDKLDDIEEDGTHNRCEDNDPDCSDELFPELVERVGIEPATDTERTCCVIDTTLYAVDDHAGVRQKTNQKSTKQPGDSVGVNDTQRIVNLREWLDLGEEVPGNPDGGRHNQADEDRPPHH